MNENRFTAAPFKTLIHSLMAAALAAVLIFSIPADNALAASAFEPVSAPSQEGIVAYAQEHPTNLASYSDSGLPLNNYTVSYRINPQTSSPFIAGALSDEELTCALNTVKTIRYIAGISDDVYLSDEYNSLAQASSLVNYVNNKLTHTPSAPSGMDSSLASAGIEGSKKSNIARLPLINCPLKSTAGWTTAIRIIYLCWDTVAGFLTRLWE